MNRDILLEGFKQNWEHMRHIERLRLSFTNVYALLAGGLLAYVITRGGDNLVAYIFLFILSVMGFILCWRTMCTAVHHRERAENLVKRLDNDISNEELKALLPFRDNNPTYNPLRIRGLYIWFYIVASIFFFVMILIGVICS